MATRYGGEEGEGCEGVDADGFVRGASGKKGKSGVWSREPGAGRRRGFKGCEVGYLREGGGGGHCRDLSDVDGIVGASSKESRVRWLRGQIFEGNRR